MNSSHIWKGAENMMSPWSISISISISIRKDKIRHLYPVTEEQVSAATIVVRPGLCPSLSLLAHNYNHGLCLSTSPSHRPDKCHCLAKNKTMCSGKVGCGCVSDSLTVQNNGFRRGGAVCLVSVEMWVPSVVKLLTAAVVQTRL